MNIMDLNMKPSLAVDEMFSEGAGYMDMEESGSATGMMLDHLPTPTNDKHVHADFYNDFDDLFDDDDNTLGRPRGANNNGRQ